MADTSSKGAPAAACPTTKKGERMRAEATELAPQWSGKTEEVRGILEGKLPAAWVAGDLRTQTVTDMPSRKVDPVFWSLAVRDIGKFYEYIEADLNAYCSQNANITPNLHTINARYIKPWTKPFPGWGFAAVWNAYELLSVFLRPEFMRVKIFISHSWSELFREHLATLRGSCLPFDRVWICAFAICQNQDIKGALGDELEDSPFWKAMAASERVIMVTDSTADAFTRIWCGMEQYLATAHLLKPFTICVPEASDASTWSTITSRLASYSIQTCSASKEEDKTKILQYIGERTGVVSRMICDCAERSVVAASVHRLSLDSQGSNMSNVLLIAGLEHCDQNGENLLHRFAALGRNAQIETLLQASMSEPALTERFAVHSTRASFSGRRPLDYAARHGNLECVRLLLPTGVHQAKSGNGLSTALLEAARGHAACLEPLLAARADAGAKNVGWTPLEIASYRHDTECMEILARNPTS